MKTSENQVDVRRRMLLQNLSIISLLSFTGCAQLTKLALRYPKELDKQPEFTEAILKTFVLTAIPSADPEYPWLTTAFSDPYYPFYRLKGFFVNLLLETSESTHGNRNFHLLKTRERERVIDKLLKGGGRKRQLMKASIALAQISYYAGIYDPENGCPMIGFYGQNFGYSMDELFYPQYNFDKIQFLTLDGNFN